MVREKRERVPMVAPPPGPESGFQAAAVLVRRLEAVLYRLAVSQNDERESLAHQANELFKEAGGLFSDACWDLKILLRDPS